jgi:hypothetical protein
MAKAMTERSDEEERLRQEYKNRPEHISKRVWRIQVLGLRV